MKMNEMQKHMTEIREKAAKEAAELCEGYGLPELEALLVAVRRAKKNADRAKKDLLTEMIYQVKAKNYQAAEELTAEVNHFLDESYYYYIEIEMIEHYINDLLDDEDYNKQLDDMVIRMARGE